ncbi:MAG: insulinase family protein [Ignavibacterium sp.]|nr:insulinase family protein [Ignavibacterium sp.]
MRLNQIFIISFILFFTSAIISSDQKEFKIDFEKYTLKNGLQVILHLDRSDPITAVAIQYHVGSNREIPGRTGFAHLFEHMMFQESQHVGQDQFFKKIQNAGGTLNGGTWKDGTIYFQVVPNNALEIVLWMEADRMGYLLSTVTQEAFINQQEVVQNEKRQSYDNQPYGHTRYVIDKLLYSKHHPYHWQVIGSLDDLRNATLEDIRDFYTKWYGPNNATLVIAGDFDIIQAKQWVEKYFGEISSSESITDLTPMPVKLTETKRTFHEDNFAQSPELNMVFPTVEQYNKDSYALSLLGELFAFSKKAPLYKVIVEEKKLAPSVMAYQSSGEIAGVFQTRIRTFPTANLTDVEKAIFEAFERFENEGFTDEDLDRVKARTETSFYNGISSVLGKSFQLAQYNEFAGSPDFITQDLKNRIAVTKDDIWNVYEKYIKNKHYVLTSFVPKVKLELVAENSVRFPVEEETIEEQEAANLKLKSVKVDFNVEKIPSSFDRSVQPGFGPEPLLKLPEIWDAQLKNGIKILGIEHNELPLVEFSITLKGGKQLDDLNKVGVANLVSSLMMEGTKNKTPLELQEEIQKLGSRIQMFTLNESITIQANCLSSKLYETLDIIQEILFEPRWDETEFERIKKQTIEGINRSKANPSSIAWSVLNKLVYGKNHILAYETVGTAETVEEITIDDLKNYYDKYFSASVANIAITGNIKRDEAVKLFSSLNAWDNKNVTLPEFQIPSMPEKPSVYFIDIPNAKQSELRIGHIGLAYSDPDFHKATVMNYKLGGSFSGIVNLILREEKGFTYGARTTFTGANLPGVFVGSTSVQSNATFESVQIFYNEFNKYREGVSKEDLEFTRNALVKSNALRFETLGALRGMLNTISSYNLPYDYIKNEEEQIIKMTLDEHKLFAQKYIIPDKMIYLIVGDASTQLEPLKNLGFGDPVLLDREGNIIKQM